MTEKRNGTIGTIGIVGLGYVGLTLAIAAADSGFEVWGVEINPKIKAALSQNKAHFHETGLDALIEKHNNKTNTRILKYNV